MLQIKEGMESTCVQAWRQARDILVLTVVWQVGLLYACYWNTQITWKFMVKWVDLQYSM